MPFLNCVLYLAAIGLSSFVIGRLLPKRWFRDDAFPYRCHPLEQKLYQALRIKVWQKKVPDMSRIFPAVMPPKKLTSDTFADLSGMIRETCVAELIHWILSLLGLVCIVLWPGAGGIVLTAVYILFGNLPFIMIQRYNRPRLQKLLDMQRRKQERSANHAHTDTKL